VPPTRAVRIERVIMLVILFSLLSSVHLLVVSGKLRPRLFGTDELTLYDHRFDGVKRALPEHGIIGYVGDPHGEEGGIRDYYLTQYALAPLIVDYSPAHHLVVGNIPDVNSTILANHDLKLLKDFGNGVRLYQNRAQ
jgi:hypothetical protein